MTDTTLQAVADVIADERRDRMTIIRELAADIARLRERVDDQANWIETKLTYALRDLVAKEIAALELKDGAPGAPGADAYPGMARGLHDPALEYRALDIVVLNGCEWRARIDNPGQLPGDGWMQCAKQGRRGDKGERGERGAPGKDGAGIADVIIDRGALVVVLTDGRTFEFMLEAAA